MRRSYLAGIIIVIITIVLTVLLWLFLRDQQSTLPVYVLVVDEFDTAVEVKPEELDGNCVVDPSGTAIGLTGASTAIGLTGAGTAIGLTGAGTGIGLTGASTNIPGVYFTMSHGAIVHEVIEKSFPEATIIDVDLDTYDTSHAAQRIKETIARRGRGYYIVNMSFSIVPCKFVASIEEYRKLFDDINMDDLENETADIDALEKEFFSTIAGIYDDGSKITDDPILRYIETACETKVPILEDQLPILQFPQEGIDGIEPPIVAAAAQAQIDLSLKETTHINIDVPPEGEVRAEAPLICRRLREDGTPMSGEKDGGIIFVAAAGNGSVSFTETRHPNIMFPFAPAIWEDVISVSAGVVFADRDKKTVLEPPHPFSSAGFDLAPYSNYGSILMPSPYQDIGGTSFAAPRYSALLAMLLTPGSVGPYDSYCLFGASPLPLPDEPWPRPTNVPGMPPPDNAPNQPVC